MEIVLPQEIGDGRIDTLLKVFSELKKFSSEKHKIQLNWSKVKRISPAGWAILACLFDAAVEKKQVLDNIFVHKEFKNFPVIQNLLQISNFKKLPSPDVHDFSSSNTLLKGKMTSIDSLFMEQVRSECGKDLPEDLDFDCELIFNELMQNSVDHANAERYYLYAGLWLDEFHIGVLDMGITIPAKLEQKYTCPNDVAYLELALKSGISTRRQRPGGYGLSHTFDLLKENKGRLTLMSRNAQIRRYFKTRKTQRGPLKYRLNGTWCFVRFPLDKRL